MNYKNLIVIPARYGSSRFPGKVIADLDGKPVVQHVYEQCIKSKKADKVVIATDHEVVLRACSSFTKDVVMTCSSHQSGTDRIAEVAGKYDCVNVVNIQGDEPFISPLLVDQLFDGLEVGVTKMVTAYHKITNEKELSNPNIVKVLINEENFAITFSRLPIPFLRPPAKFKDFDFFRHVGVYGYKADFLNDYINMPESKMEQAEQLEQLRVVQSGYAIGMVLTDSVSIGIDTPEDLVEARKQLSESNK